MNGVPATPQMLEVARRIVWFEPPEKALTDPVRFMAYAMTYARHEDMRVIRQYVSDEDFCEALDRAPPGIIDPRSWAYWNLKMGRFPPPPQRKRTFGESSLAASTLGAEKRRSIAAQEWRKIRDARAPADREEIRRRAAAEWLKRFGPKSRR